LNQIEKEFNSNPLLDLIMDGTPLHPPHGQQIDERSHHAITNIVFGLAELPRMVGNGDFNDPISLPLDEGGKKSMHTIKHWYISNTLLLKCPKGARTIMDVLTAQPVPNSVTDFRRGFLQPCIFSFLAPSCCHIVMI
jgi:hypothetical protein